jgi:hypothetical protein
MMTCQSVDGVCAVSFDGQNLSEIGAVQKELKDLRARIEEPSPDLVGIVQRLKQLSNDIEETASRAYGELEQRIVQESRTEARDLLVQMDTEPLKSLAKEQDKWVKVGFDRALLKTDPEAVHFAVSTKLLFTIAMYDRSAAMLQGDPLTIRNVGGAAHFKVEGEWMPYAAFKDRIQYSPEFEKFPGWNFVHPQGFVNRDRAEYERIYPVAQLNEDGYKALAAHAQGFWSDKQPEIDPGIAKPCILQVVTTGRNRLPDMWLAKNFREHFPEHAGVRVIMPNGDVYSFGTELPRPDERFLACREHYMGSGLANLPVPDYEEPRNSDDRSIVAVPISPERAEQILDFVSRANKGIPFNFARQNCVRFAEVSLRLAGVTMSARVSYTELIGHIVPRLSDIPYLGKIITLVSGVASKIFACIGSVAQTITPYPLQQAWTAIEWMASQAGARLAAMALNSLALLVLGAENTIIPPSAPDASSVPEVDHFDRVITWDKFFSPDAIPVYYSARLKQWMLEQSNFRVVQKPQNGFCCLGEGVAS